MAETKNLNTRIKLKYDTYSEWDKIKSTFIPLKGEVCICEILSGSGSGLQEPVVIIKVGDGVKTYGSLPYASALAADVYSWAKASTKPTYAANEIVGLETYINQKIQDTDTDTRYAFTVDAATGKLTITPSTYDVKAGTHVAGEAVTFDAVSADELTAALAPYAKTAEVKATTDALADRIEALENTDHDFASADDTLKAELTTAIATAKSEAIAAAEQYADDNDTDTTYGITYDSANRKIKLVAGGTDTEIDASAFVKDGMITGATLDGTDLVITFNTDAGVTDNTVRVPLNTLVDVYTGIDGTTVQVNVTADKKIGAEVKAGTITTSHIAANAGIVKSQLASSVQASLGKADSALQSIETLNIAGKTYNGTTAVTVAKTDIISNAEKNQTTDSTFTQIKITNGVLSATSEKIAITKDQVTDFGNYDTAGSAAAVQTDLNSYKESNDAALALKANSADLATIAKTGNVNDLVQTSGDWIVFDCGSATTVI